MDESNRIPENEVLENLQRQVRFLESSVIDLKYRLSAWIMATFIAIMALSFAFGAICTKL